MGYIIIEILMVYTLYYTVVLYIYASIFLPYMVIEIFYVVILFYYIKFPY